MFNRLIRMFDVQIKHHVQQFVKRMEMPSYTFNKKRCTQCLVIVIIVIGAMFLVSNFASLNARWMNVQAAWIENKQPEKAYRLYQQSYDVYPTVGALTGQLHFLITQGRYAEAITRLDMGKKIFYHDDAFQRLLDHLKPFAPTVSLETGVYDRVQTVYVTYEPEIHSKTTSLQTIGNNAVSLSNKVAEPVMVAVRVNDAEVQYFPIDLSTSSGNTKPMMVPLTKNGTYTLEVWSINALSLESEHKRYTYTLRLPQPVLNVEPKGGTYTENKRLTLSIDHAHASDKVAIYYTLDGSDPIKDGHRYTEPFELPYGLTHLKAIAIDASGMESTMIDEQYRIGIPKHGLLFFDGIFASGYAYDYRAYPGKLMLYTKDGQVSVHVATDGMCSSLQEVGDTLYGICQKKIYQLDLKHLTLRPMSDVNVSKLAIVQHILFYVDAATGHLYVTELNQFAPRKILDKKIKALDVDHGQGKLYVSIENEGVYAINALSVFDAPTITVQNIINEAVEAFYVHDPSWNKSFNPERLLRENSSDTDELVYFIQNGTLYRQHHGQKIAVKEKEETHDEENRPWFGTYHVLDTTTSYTGLVAAGNRLYVREKIVIDDTKRGSWTGRIVQKSSRQRYVWYEVRLDTGQIRPTNVRTSLLFVTDAGMIDENGTFYEYEQ